MEAYHNKRLANDPTYTRMENSAKKAYSRLRIKIENICFPSRAPVTVVADSKVCTKRVNSNDTEKLSKRQHFGRNPHSGYITSPLQPLNICFSPMNLISHVDVYEENNRSFTDYVMANVFFIYVC